MPPIAPARRPFRQVCPARRPRLWAAIGWLLAATGLCGTAMAGPTLDAVRARGQLHCGVSTSGLQGLSAQGADGRWQGLDVDICRAVAAAVLGDPDKVRYTALTNANRFDALLSGQIDVLSRSTSVTLARDASMGLQMTAIAFYDTQGFMVPAKSRIRAARQLKDKTVCVQQSTTTVRNLAEYSRTHNLAFKTLAYDSADEVNAAYFGGRCDAYTGDMSQLAAIRARRATSPDLHTLLPDIVAKEPLGPVVKRGDQDWTTVVRWVVFGLIEAEELGITQANLEQLRATSQEPAIQRIVGTGDDTGKLLGLERDWLARALRATGNYGEIFERHLGTRTPLALPRGLNNLWNRGGLHYALPVR